MAVQKKHILNKVYLLTGFMFLFAIAIVYKLVQIEFVHGDAYRELARARNSKNL